MSVAMVGAGIAAVGVVSQANSASKASKAQQASSREAAELERETRDLIRADNAPYLERGNQAGNRLQYMMGLSATPGSGPGGAQYKTLDQFKEELAAKQGGGLTGPNDPGWQWEGVTTGADGQPIEWIRGKPHRMTVHGAEDYSYAELDSLPQAQGSAQADLDAQAQALFDQQEAARQQAEASAQSDPAYGSLMRKFSKADLDSDVVYKSGLEFGLNEGTKAINNRAGAGGAFLSGATLKALTRFGNDYGSTKAGDARNRFVNDQDNQFNRLSGIVGTGQTATNQVSGANSNYAARAGDYMTQGGNAAAAGYVGQGNAVSNGLSQGYGMYQNNELMKMIRNPGGGGWSPSMGPSSAGMYTSPDYGSYL